MEELRRVLEEPGAGQALAILSGLGVPWVVADAVEAVARIDEALARESAPDLPVWALRLGAGVTRAGLEEAAVPGWARAMALATHDAAALATALEAAGTASERDRVLSAADPATAAAALAAGAEAVATWWAGDRGREIAVTGADLVAAGVAPGPAIGAALERVRAAMLDGRVDDRDAATRPGAARRPGTRMTAPELIEVPTGAPARAVFTTRRGGVSGGPFAALNLGAERGDDDADVRANRALVCGALGLDGDAVSMLHQVHGRDVVAGGDPAHRGRFLGALRGWPDGDALVSDVPGAGAGRARRGLPARAPVAPRSPRGGGGARGLARSGGRRGGVRRGGARRPVPARRRDRPGDRPLLLPGVGRGARAVRRPFRGRPWSSARRWIWPPRRAVRSETRGSPTRRSQAVDACTSCEPERFFSFRRDGEASGRQAGIVWAGAR